MAESRKLRCLWWVCGIAVVLLILGVIGVYSGIYNVSAMAPDSPLAIWFFGTISDHSVSRHARGIQAPPLGEPARVREGFSHYRAMCVMCHGAPGIEPEELARGLRPLPPKLVESVADMPPEEAFWVIKNGIRMTGMPSFGVTHTDEQIWAITAFVKKLPSLSSAEYRAMAKSVPPEKE